MTAPHPTQHRDRTATQDHCPFIDGCDERCEAVSVSVRGVTNTELGTVSEFHLCENGHGWSKQWEAPTWGRAS